MSNEDLYLKASSEVDGGNKNSALWAKALTLCEGNEEKAKYSYIKLRVEQLESIKPTLKPAPKPVVKKPAPKPVVKKPAPKPVVKKPAPKPVVKKPVPKPVVRKDLPESSVTKQTKEKNVGTVAKFKLSKKLFDVIEMNYIPVKKFAVREGFSPEKAIQMIRDGLHHGHLVDGRWYVYDEESEGSVTKVLPDESELPKSDKSTIGIYLMAAAIGYTVVTNDFNIPYALGIVFSWVLKDGIILTPITWVIMTKVMKRVPWGWYEWINMLCLTSVIARVFYVWVLK